MLTLISVLLFAIIGAIVSRMCGGGKPRLPWGLDQFIYGLPYAIAGSHWFVNILSYAGAVLGKRTGHGQYFWLDAPRENVPPENDESFDFIVTWFFGTDEIGKPNRLYRNLFGMLLSGIWPVLITTIVLAFSGHLLAALIFLIGGSLKPLCYFVSERYTRFGTEGGEYATGFFGWGSIALAFSLNLT